MATSAREIHQLNIRHYRKLLDTETNPGRRKTIISLLRKEQGNLAELDRSVGSGSSLANRASGTE